MILLTFDTDWCPTKYIDTVFRILDRYSLKATMFCTDPVLPQSRPDGLEIGWHPNLMNDSTQGQNVDDVFEYLRFHFPMAKGARTHRLFWYSGLANEYECHGLKYDASISMMGQILTRPVETHTSVVRFPIWWGDEWHYRNKRSTNYIDLEGLKDNGIKVFLFHPKYINEDQKMAEYFEMICQYILNNQGPSFALEDLLC